MSASSEEIHSKEMCKLDNRPARRITVPKRYSCYEDFSNDSEGPDANTSHATRRKKRSKKLGISNAKSSNSESDLLNGESLAHDLYSALNKHPADRDGACSDFLPEEIDRENDEKFKYGANAFICQECGKVLRSKITLLRHTISHSGSKPFLCSICQRGFSSAVALKEHKARHENKMLYECDICCKSFRQNSCYRRHLMTHSQSCKYACSICDRRFACKDYLRSHMKSHNGEKKYQCSQCSKAFARVSDLNRHKILHSGMRPYKCDICGMSFADSSSCRRHVKDHNSGLVQVYPCEHCKLSFRKPSLLKQHLAKKHKMLPSSSECDSSSVTTKSDDTDVLSVKLPDSDSGITEIESSSSSSINAPEVTVVGGDMHCVQSSLPHDVKEIPAQDFIGGQFQPAVQSKAPLSVAIDYENFFASDIQGVDFSQISNVENSALQDLTPTMQDHHCIAMGEVFCTDLQPVSTAASGYSMQEDQLQNPSHIDYITNPDFNSQAYYTWLSDFTALCKLLTFPIESDLFNKISQVHKSIADVLAEPLGFLNNKANFKILRGITQDLLQVTNGHLNFVYEHLQE